MNIKTIVLKGWYEQDIYVATKYHPINYLLIKQ